MVFEAVEGFAGDEEPEDTFRRFLDYLQELVFVFVSD